MKDNGEPRKASGIKMAESRAVDCIAAAVGKAGSRDCQSYALAMYANRADSQEIVHNAGLKVPEETEKKMEMLENQVRHLQRIVGKGGQLTDDRDSAVQTILDASVASPDRQSKLTTKDYQKYFAQHAQGDIETEGCQVKEAKSQVQGDQRRGPDVVEEEEEEVLEQGFQCPCRQAYEVPYQSPSNCSLSEHGRHHPGSQCRHR